MKITFICRNVGNYFSAIAYVLLRYAYQLEKIGNDVIVIVPADRGDSLKKENFLAKPNLSYKLRKFSNVIRGKNVFLQCKWIDVNDFDVPIIEVPTLKEKYIPDADVIIAGSSWMLDAIKEYPLKKGKKFYIIQGYELDNPLNIERYKLPVKKIAVSTYLKEKILSKIPDISVEVINNGVDINFFNAENRKYNNPPKRIGMVYYYKAPYKIKAVSDGIKAFEIVKEKYSFLQLVMFGTKKDNGVPEYAEFYASPDRKKIAEIYKTCDIFLSPSKEEACQLPPMEAMASGCACVATKVGGVPDYTIPGETALVCEPGDIEQLANNIENLIKDPHLFKKISTNGRNFIEKFSWENVSVKLENYLKENMEKSNGSVKK
ncbi:MAG TPA: glycosyltransferase family 4 protein [Candidatus Ratteibacteria bacterium]|nr:glycosyltransferase family 4 protein [Candidatus Ratteibacteria bacterium]